MIVQGRRRVVGVIDYGVGNVASVCGAFEALGLRCKVSREPSILKNTDFLVLPGVGAFPYAISLLNRYGLSDYICTWAHSGKPMLGICLGMHLLADESKELQFTQGLGVIPGQVVEVDGGKRHIGWNSIKVVNASIDGSGYNSSRYNGSSYRNTNTNPIAVYDGEAMYFNHTYKFDTDQKYHMATVQIDPASQPFLSILKKDNIVGIQFHPEKSQSSGRRILSTILEDIF